MERLGNYLRQNLPQLQQLVEEKLHVPLGKIEIKPIPQCVNEIADDIAKETKLSPAVMYAIKKAVQISIFLTEDGYFLKGSRMIAKAGQSTIYYSRSPIAVLPLTPDNMMMTGLHELTHVAHSKLGNISLTKKPTKYAEAFAEYVAMEIMQEQGRTVTNISYFEELFEFNLQLYYRKLKTIDQVVQFVLEQKQTD